MKTIVDGSKIGLFSQLVIGRPCGVNSCVTFADVEQL